ncbi:ATP-dependent DNA ligase [Salmonella phage ST53]|nr:ATP-dependent DNA ligase [Salmonella phage ST66]WJJ59490.1 ATP-dependent DNA ligase [Salmonella phage ST64]WJJ59542.1 ATP-dependent DNA ligase [Salmonella phage ST63]WJJ59580.1 ATP-dependent DNA ligase [Salmonella phage ST59]WJJ59729.1 ATP-dependent DNA ligase [Salmonella phage ST55]WJJ59795.1 ATP-dependent DNA ligase [Salmonella phage ST53]WQZ00346.1 ATP-dependent DNA ligase [Salmonella phage Vb_SalP_792]
MTTTIKTNPHRAVDYSESGVKKALAAAGSLEAEVKYDGVRLNLPVLREGETYWLSRESKPLPALEWMNSELGNAWTQADWRWFLRQAGYEGIGLMIDGEVMVKGVDFNTSSGLIRTKWLKPSNEHYAECYPGRGKKVPFWVARSRLQVVVYGVVDMTTIADPTAEGPIHSVTRLKAEAIVPLLQKYLPEIDWVLSESHTVYDLESLNSLYEEKRLEGHEGLVVKDPLGKYKRGKKSGMWKMKPEETIDGTVCGLVWGTPGKANEGKVIGFEVLLEDGMVVNACGLTEEQKDEFTKRVKDYTTECNANEAGCWYMNPYEGWQVEVLFMERFPDGSLRHPSFKCWRGTEDNPTIKS